MITSVIIPLCSLLPTPKGSLRPSSGHLPTILSISADPALSSRKLLPPIPMDRSPYYADPRGSAPRSSASRGSEAELQRGLERLPPVLPTEHSLSKRPLSRPDALTPLGHARLPPIKDSDSRTSPYAGHRPYPSMSDLAPFDPGRRPSPPSSVPVGLVSADYMHSRRSPGDSAPPPYHSLHRHHPDSYRQEALSARVSSHVPHHTHYHGPPTLVRHASEVDLSSTGTPIKRPRVSLACLACRNRKSRCDGVRPTCKTCANMSEHPQSSRASFACAICC